MIPQDRIELTYRRALEVLPPAGSRWYPTEAGRIRHEADRFDAEHAHAIRMASALSPRVQWERVVGLFLPAALGGESRPAGCFSQSWRKAHAILAGFPWESVLDPKTSPKTNAFARALLGEPVAVIDSWAARIAGCKPPGTLRQYRAIEQAYVDVASRFDVRPDELQADCWVACRDLGVEVVA